MVYSFDNLKLTVFMGIKEICMKIDSNVETININQVFSISTLMGPSVNRKDLQALTLVGPTQNNSALDP